MQYQPCSQGGGGGREEGGGGGGGGGGGRAPLAAMVEVLFVDRAVKGDIAACQDLRLRACALTHRLLDGVVLGVRSRIPAPC